MPTATFPGRFSSLADIAQFVTQAAREAGLDSKAAYAVQLAVDEACSNIIEHAYGGEGCGQIECTCDVTPRGLRVVLSDQGESFDPASIPPPNLHVPLKDRQSGGLGIYLIRKMMDEVTYETAPEGVNRLTMVKEK
jgi:serine/threonine-protein kinase RsbW